MNEDEFQARRGARLNPNQPLGEGNIYPTPDQQPNLAPIEGIFKTPLPKSNVTTEHAKALHLEGKFFHPETNKPLYGAPRDFYQWKARESIDNAVSLRGVGGGFTNVFQYLDAFAQVAAPIVYPFVEPIVNISKHGIWQSEEDMKAAGEDFSRNMKWSENTTDALHNLFTGQITENQAVEQLSAEFQDRPFSEQLLLSLPDPTQVGKVKLAGIGTKTLLAGLPFAIGRTSNKLKNLAKDPALNLRLNHWDSVLDNVPKPSPKEFVKNIRLGFEEKMIDKFAYANKVTNRLQREWREMFGDIRMPDELHIEMQLALFNGLGSSVSLKVNETLSQVRKLLKDTNINGTYVDDFLNLKHLEAVHDAHPKRALPAGFNVKEDIGNAIDAMATELTGPRMARVIDSARLIRDEYRRILNEFMNEDMVDRELGEKLIKMYPWYNPIAYSDDLAIVMSGGKGEASKVLRHLSDRGNVENLDVLPPLRIFPQMISRLEYMLATNKIARNFVHALEMSGEIITEIKGKNVPVAVQKVFDDVESAWKEEKIFRHQPLDLSKINKPIIHYLGEGGKLKVFEVPIEAFQSFQMMTVLNGIGDGFFPKLITKVQGAFKTSYTSGSPSFLARQLVNDLITVGVLEKTLPHHMAAGLYRALRHVFKENPMMRELRLAGGDVTGYHGREWEKVLDDMMGPVKDSKQSVLNVDKSIYNQLFNPLSWIENLKRIAHNMEMAPRLAVFDRNLGAGETVEYAAWRARNSTGDFQKTGTWMQVLNRIYAFANMATQGAGIVPRALMNPRTRKGATIGLTGYGIATVLSYLQNRTDPNYYHMDFSERAKIGFMLGSNERYTSGARIGEKKPHYAVISPLSRELAIVSAPIIYLLEHLEQALPEAMQAEGSLPPRKEDLGYTLYNAYNALNAILGLSVNSLWGGVKALVPTEPGRVAIEIASNHDGYFDRPIVPAGYENLPEEEQFDDYTSEMAKRVGPYIPGLNPFQIDHLIKTGEFEELVIMADSLIRKFIMEEDVLADSYYRELEDLLDHVEPNQMRTTRRRFLSEFSKEMQDRIITIERQKPETFPEHIPVVSKVVDGFIRRKSGALHERGILAAEDLTNMSAEQTKEVSRGIGQFWGEFGTKYMQEAETGLLAYIENPYRIDGVEIVSPKEFLEQEKILNNMFQFKLMELKTEFPKAAQLQDKQTWLDWQNEVFSVGKQLDDSRSVAEINAALLRAIPLFDYVEGEEITIDPNNNITSKNWRKYFEYRDEVEKEIVKNFGQEGLEEAEEVLTASLTTMQRKRREDYDFIRPYWDVVNYLIDLHESNGDDDIRKEYEIYERLEGDAAINYINQQEIVTDEDGVEYKRGTVLNDIVNSQIPNARKALLTGELFYENGKWTHIGNLSDAEQSEQKSHGPVGAAGWTGPLLRERKMNAAEMEKTVIFWGIRENVIGFDSSTGNYDSNELGLNSAWDYNRQAILDQQRQIFNQMEQMNIQR